MREPVISIQNVSFGFKVPVQNVRTFKDIIHHSFRHGIFSHHPVLHHIQFSIQKGESVALLGKNGSGKSTILKMIAGIIQPDKGLVKVRGKISPLLALGVGLEPELTGKENIFYNAALVGIERKKRRTVYEKVKVFSDLTEAELTMQVKRYSSGMSARLAFSLAIAEQPEILLVDEVLAVGDQGFQDKCYARMEAIKKQGTTIVFVSHAPADVQRICDRALLLHQGKLILDGATEPVLERYLEICHA